MRGRPKKGTAEWHVDHWDARPTGDNGARGARVCQPVGASKEAAQRKALELTRLAVKRGRARATEAEPTPPEGLSLSAWSTPWCAAREAKGHTSVDDDRGRLRKWILSRPIGAKTVAAVSKADLEIFVEDLDERVRRDELSWKTAQNVWGLVTKMFSDAANSKVRALRVRADNPALGIQGPDEGTKKSKGHLYPEEFLALAACSRVVIRWRQLFATAIYTYARAGELEALGLEDIDLERGLIHIHRSVDRRDGTDKETKTNCPRRIPIEPSFAPLLTTLVTMAKAEGRAKLLVMPPIEDLSANLRRYLEWSGVKRAELFADDATRKHITFHDLRATGITWMAIRGDEPLRIQQRAGHKNFSTTQGYIRTAETLGRAVGEVFPTLPKALFLPGILPEGPADWGKLRKPKQKIRASPAGFEACGRGSESQETPRKTLIRVQKEPMKRPSDSADLRAWAEFGQNSGGAVARLLRECVTLAKGAEPDAEEQVARRLRTVAKALPRTSEPVAHVSRKAGTK